MRIKVLVAALFVATPSNAALDLSRASVERLDNGLTLIMLEDRTFPVVSIQTVYRTGARDDPAGRLGLAHFFEHMAFRGSKNFPETGLVSEIYAAGGEWHGYTWIDLTTYFATAPKENLGLLLDIEADRLARLDLKADEAEAERGAVLAEMNGYANDPDSTLFDMLMAAHFLTHPYRNNTIGYPADIAAIGYDDIVSFYERHYAPQNAIIALVGDFNRDEARRLIRDRFAGIKKRVAPRDPLTAEPPRSGERRVRISLPSDEKLFKIAYPAPAASHEDFPAFLVLQALIGEPAGVNFNQNDWGTPVGAGSPIAKAASDLRTWIIPTAEPYAFVVSGSAAPSADEAKIERRIQTVFADLARAPVSADRLAAAKEKALAALAFDVDTTEEVAHQLAYFAGVGALDDLFTLEGAVKEVTPEKVANVARNYLGADQRTIAWLEPGATPAAIAAPAAAEASPRAGEPGDSRAALAPVTSITKSGAPLIFQQSNFSQTTTMKAVLDGRYECQSCAVDWPAFGLTTLAANGGADRPENIAANLLASIRAAKPHASTQAPSDDPLTRLEEVFSATFGGDESAGKRVLVATASGAIREASAIAFGNQLPAAEGAASTQLAAPVIGGDREIRLDAAKAQEAVGFLAAAAAAGDGAALAMRIALYVLSHGYEGRLGKEAISRQGLAYYIDAQYRAGVSGGLVTLAAGVDPEKVDAFRKLLKAEIARLSSEPPTEAEIAEAKRHLIGRKISAAQSNDEIADALIKDFLAVGGPESAVAFAARLDKVAREDVLKAVEALQKGAVVSVRGGGVE